MNEPAPEFPYGSEFRFDVYEFIDSRHNIDDRPNSKMETVCGKVIGKRDYPDRVVLTIRQHDGQKYEAHVLKK